MINLEEIRVRKAKLEAVKEVLLTEFHGIEEPIEKLINSIVAWYCFPDLIIRPPVVMLMGQTGVGKTSLIRRLVQLLDLQNKFVELTLDNVSEKVGGEDTICGVLQSSSINEGEPGILFLDEIQKFRTKEVDGSLADIKRFPDLWLALSDGKFPSKYSFFSRIEDELAQEAYYSNLDLDDDDDDSESSVKDFDFKKIFKNAKQPPVKKKKKKKKKAARPKVLTCLAPYQARTYKKLLRLPDSIFEIMAWPKARILELCYKALNERKSDTIDYSKTLIIMAGNNDELYSMSDEVSDIDIDPDIYHNITKKLTVLDAKSSLNALFLPEQVARFGSNYIIYPSLSRDAYEKIIKSTCSNYINEIKDKTGVLMTLTQKFYDVIFKNSVIASQGTRPVFSAIHKILGSSMLDVTFWCAENNITECSIDIDSDRALMLALANNPSFDIDDGEYVKTKEFPVDLEIDSIKKRNSVDFNTIVAVHEAGHAIIYSLLLKFAPAETKINIASFKGGFMAPSDDLFDNKTDLLNDICVSMGGAAAEEIVFGNQYRLSGASSDILNATANASSYVRSLGFGSTISKIATQDFPGCNYNVEQTNPKIEKLVKTEFNRAKKLIKTNKDLFKEIVKVLLADNAIDSDGFVRIAAKHGLKLTKKTTDVNHNYSQEWKKF